MKAEPWKDFKPEQRVYHILTSHGDKDGDRAELRAPSSVGWPPEITPFEDSECTVKGKHLAQSFSLIHEPYLDGPESTMTLRKKNCGVIGNGNPSEAENVSSNLRKGVQDLGMYMHAKLQAHAFFHRFMDLKHWLSSL